MESTHSFLRIPLDRKKTRAAIIIANATAKLSRSRSPARSTAWRRKRTASTAITMLTRYPLRSSRSSILSQRGSGIASSTNNRCRPSPMTKRDDSDQKNVDRFDHSYGKRLSRLKLKPSLLDSIKNHFGRRRQLRRELVQPTPRARQ